MWERLCEKRKQDLSTYISNLKGVRDYLLTSLRTGGALSITASLLTGIIEENLQRKFKLAEKNARNYSFTIVLFILVCKTAFVADDE